MGREVGKNRSCRRNRDLVCAIERMVKAWDGFRDEGGWSKADKGGHGGMPKRLVLSVGPLSLLPCWVFDRSCLGRCKVRSFLRGLSGVCRLLFCRLFYVLSLCRLLPRAGRSPRHNRVFRRTANLLLASSFCVGTRLQTSRQKLDRFAWETSV